MTEKDQRLEQIKFWLKDKLALPYSKINRASEDASFRRYFRIDTDEQSFIIMDAPPDKESCQPFVDITERLLECDLNVPNIVAKDLSQGFLLISDLGEQLYLSVLNEEKVGPLYTDAIDALIHMQQRARIEGLPLYNEQLLLSEVELFSDWLLQRHLNLKLSPAEKSTLDNSFSFLIETAIKQPKVFVHRDYHSRNLLFTKSNNPGILDYQDAVSGPATYDLVSLLKDCYIKWPMAKQELWINSFYHKASHLHSEYTADEFIKDFHLMGVQRHLKASGIFARLFHRDGKDGYLNDIERTLSYITDLEGSFSELDGLMQLIKTRVQPILAGVNQKWMS